MNHLPEPVGRLSYLEQPRKPWVGASIAELVFGYIKEHPGCFHRQIRKGLELSSGAVAGTIKLLRKQGRIKSTGVRPFMQHWPI